MATALTPSTAFDQPYFKYEPLVNSQRETRLLTLLPGSGEDVICCEMTNVSRPIRGEYDALSYEWGEQSNPKEILVNSVSFVVGQNLFSFLSQIRSQFHDRLPLRLWVDAICIDQKDDLEKGHQVKRMYEIFSHAKTVLSWLGGDEDGAEVWFEHLKTVWRSLPKGCLCSAREPEDCQKLFKLLFGGNNGAKLFLSAKKVYWRPYFARTWIVPEVVHAQEVVLLLGRYHLAPGGFEILQQVSYMEDILRGEYHFGPNLTQKKDDLDLQKLFRAGCSNPDGWESKELGIFRFPESNILSKSPGYAVCQIRQQKLCGHCGKNEPNETLISLESLLRKFEETQCSDPRDSIYALLSITRPAGGGSHWLFEGFDINYQQPLLDVVLSAAYRIPGLDHRMFLPFLSLLCERGPVPRFREISEKAMFLTPDGNCRLQANYIGSRAYADPLVSHWDFVRLPGYDDSIFITDAGDRLRGDYHFFQFSPTPFVGIYELFQGQLRYVAGAFEDRQHVRGIYPKYTEHDDQLERLSCLQGLERQGPPTQIALRRVDDKPVILSFEVDVTFLQLLAVVCNQYPRREHSRQTVTVSPSLSLIADLCSIQYGEAQTLVEIAGQSQDAIKLRQEGDAWKLVDAPNDATLSDSLQEYSISVMSSGQTRE